MKEIIIVLILSTLSLVKISQAQQSITKTLVTDNLYKVEIGTVNLLAYIYDEGVLLADCGFKSSGTRLDSLLKTISPNPVEYIINSHWHHDHCGGNFHFHKSCKIISHDDTKELLSQNYTSSFWQEEYEAFPDYALPDITFKEKMTFSFTNEEIDLIHLKGGHCNGNIIIHFKNSNVLFLSDLLFSFGFPAIDFEHGGSVLQFAKNFDYIIQTMPRDITIVAGHGPNFTIEELEEYRDMLTETFAIIKENMNEGLSMEEIKKKDVLGNYKKWADGYFSCEDWIEIVYSSISYTN